MTNQKIAYHIITEKPLTSPYIASEMTIKSINTNKKYHKSSYTKISQHEPRITQSEKEQLLKELQKTFKGENDGE